MLFYNIVSPCRVKPKHRHRVIRFNELRVSIRHLIIIGGKKREMLIIVNVVMKNNMPYFFDLVRF